MRPNYSEEKYEVQGVQGRKQVVVFSQIPDEDTLDSVPCIRIEEKDTRNL